MRVTQGGATGIHNLAAGGHGRGRPVRAQGATLVTSAFGAEPGAPAAHACAVGTSEAVRGQDPFGGYRNRTGLELVALSGLLALRAGRFASRVPTGPE